MKEISVDEKVIYLINRFKIRSYVVQQLRQKNFLN